MKNRGGLDDRQNHSDLSGCEGSQMQHFHQCYLFHELWDHADVGTWGMLNLRSIWIEVKPHRSGDFVICNFEPPIESKIEKSDIGS